MATATTDAARAASGGKGEPRGSTAAASGSRGEPRGGAAAGTGGGRLSYRDVLLFRVSKENEILARLQENYPEAYEVMAEAFALVRRWRTIAAVQVGDEYITPPAAVAMLRDVFKNALGDPQRNPAFLGQSLVDLAGEFAMIFRRDLGARVLTAREFCALLGADAAADGGLSFAEAFDVQAWVDAHAPQPPLPAAPAGVETALSHDGGPAAAGSGGSRQEHGEEAVTAAVGNPPPRRGRPPKASGTGEGGAPGTLPQVRSEVSGGRGPAAASQPPAPAAAAPASAPAPLQLPHRQVTREALLECLGLDGAEREVFEHLSAPQFAELAGLGDEIMEAAGELRARLISRFKDRLYELNG